MSSDHKLAAILFADIAGYTAMMQKNEQSALELLNRFKIVLHEITPKFQGRIVQYFGDGCLLSFDSSTSSVDCAIALQKAFCETPSVPVRIGLHLGDVIFRNENVFGDGVNVASRIESLGIPGAILLSKSIRDQIKNKSDFLLVSLGSFDFKNVSEPMEVFALANPGFVVPKREQMHGKLKDIKKKSGILKWLSGITLIAVSIFALWYFIGQKKSSVSTNEKSIAVLYFENISGDSAQESFSDGITVDIITHISKIKTIDVKDHSAVQSYKGKLKNLEKIAKELNVSFILEGTVRKSEDTFRITAHLIDVHTGKLIWGENYDRDMKKIFETQSEIARMIAQQLKIEITPEADAKINQAPTQNVEAYEQFQKGMFFAYKKFFNTGQKEDIEKSKKYFEAAIQLDSGYAEAYAGLAEVYDGQLMGNNYEHPKELYDLKEKLARKALQLKPNSSYVNTAMAWALLHRPESNFDSSFFYLKKAFYLDPKDPLTNWNLSWTLSEIFGLNSPAIPFTLNTIKADPLDPNSYFSLGKQYARLGKYPEAKKALQSSFELSDNPFNMEEGLLFYLVYLGEYDKAETRFNERAGIAPLVKSLLYASKGEMGKVRPEDRNNIMILLASNRNKVLKDVIMQIETRVENGDNTGSSNYDFLSHSFYFDAYRNDPDFIRALAKAKKNHDTYMLKYGNIEMPE